MTDWVGCMGPMEECRVWWCPGGYHPREAETRPWLDGLPLNPNAARGLCNWPHDEKALRRRREIRIELGERR